MGCRICGRGSCTQSFHSLEEQQEHEEIYGMWEDKIEELNNEIKKLKKDNNKMYNLLTDEQMVEFEEEE